MSCGTPSVRWQTSVQTTTWSTQYQKLSKLAKAMMRSKGGTRPRRTRRGPKLAVAAAAVNHPAPAAVNRAAVPAEP